MEDQEKLTQDESLEIISNMIQQAKFNVNQGSFHLLLWGWIITISSLSHFFLIKLTDYQSAYYAWLLVIPGFFVSFIYGWKEGSKQRVSTYADRINMWIWVAFAIVFIILSVFITDLGNKFGPLVLLLAGYATFLSGQVLRFKPLITGGILFWFFAVVSYFLDNEYSLLITAFSVLTGYLIPGYLLKNKVKNVTF